MSEHPRGVARAIASIVSIAVLFVSVPTALLAVTRFRFDASSPLADLDAPWRWTFDEIRTAARTPLGDDAVVNLAIRASLSVIWVALAIIAISIVVEFVHMSRHRGLPAPPVRGLGWAQRIGRWVATGLVVLLPVGALDQQVSARGSTTPTTTMQRWSQAAAGGTAPIAHISLRDAPAALVPMEPHATGRSEQSEESTAESRHTVTRGESVYGIAHELVRGNDAAAIRLAEQILDLNLGSVMNDGQRFITPALIQPGWTLRLPAGVASTPRRSPGETEVAAQHVIVEGDTLFDLAGHALGDPSVWPEIWELNRGGDMGGGDMFDDPNLILPGWTLELPTNGDGGIETSIVTPQGGPARTIPGDPNPVDTSPPFTPENSASPDNASTTPDAPSTTADGASTTAASTSTEPIPVDNGVPTQPAPEASVVPTTTTPPAPLPPDGNPVASGTGSTPRAPSPIQLEHAALLAAGILTLVGVRRRRTLRASLPHARVPAPRPEVAATERRLRTVDPGERAMRVDVATRAASHHLADTGVQIGSIRVGKDGQLIMRLTGGAHLDAPWTGDGATWVLPAAVPIELLSQDARRVGQPCLALVTVGIDADGRDVLVDLEAAGIVAVEANGDQADEVVRAIGSGLATSLSSEVVHLVVSSLGSGCLFDHPNTRVAGTVDEMIDAALATVGSTAANGRSSFDLRARRTGGEMWEPAIMLFAVGDAAARCDRLAQLPGPGHGIAAVLAAGPGERSVPTFDIGVRLTAEADRWVLAGFGESLDVTPIGLTPRDIEELTEVIAVASAATQCAPTSCTIRESHQVLELVDDSNRPFEPMPHDVVVTLMGGVGVTDRDGCSGVFERSKTVELIAWLATHRERPTRTAARTALWELDVRDATFANVVSEARRGLGRLVAPPEGEEWVGRTLTESLPLHERVTTDADLIRERVEHARLAPPAHAIAVLRPAVEMIRDMPFAGTSYLWPDADGIASNLVLLATTASAELAGHALSIGDIDLVFWATGHGLKVLPGHEELIGLRMRAHARAGDLAGVRHEWESYERVINADSWSDGEPAPKLLGLRRELLSATT